MPKLGPIEISLLLVISGIYLIPFVSFWQIFKKAGYSPWLTLLFVVPMVNLVLLLWFAFSDWPCLRQGKIVGGRCMTCGQVVADRSPQDQMERA